MKISVELSFILEEEPRQFANIDTESRKKYVWGDKVASFNTSGNYSSYRRSSEQTTDEHGFMEILEPLDESPPPNVDDCWEEDFKRIEGPTVSLEWHPSQNMIRLCWNQQSQSLQEGKVKSVVLEHLRAFSLDLPPLAKVMLN